MNILITSVGRRGYMVDHFKTAINGRGKVHAANSVLTYALQKADLYFLTPNIHDSDYIGVLIDYCKSHNINMLISLFDIDLPVLAKNKNKFKSEGIKLLISDYSFIEICNDKWLTHQFIIKNGFNTSKTFINLEEVKKSLVKKEIRFPLIIKPRWGMGSLGIFQADNEEELNVFYNKAKKTIQETYLKYESVQSIDECIIIQEKLGGEEWGLDIFNDLETNYLSCVPKRKIAMRAGETDIAVTSKDRKLIDFGKKISRNTKHCGNLDVDFFIIDNEYYILEFNCRFGGQYPFSHIAGVNFPKVLIDLVNNRDVDERDLQFEEITAFKDLEVRKI